MLVSKLVLAVLPALALAQDTTTKTSTTTLTKTYSLSQVHTVTATYTGQNTAITTSANSTTPVSSTPSAWSTPLTPGATHLTSFTSGTATASGGSQPSVVTTTGAGSALDASKVVLAGFAGMVAIALM